MALTAPAALSAKENAKGYVELAQPAADGIYNFFSYACGHCYRFHPHVERLRGELKNAGYTLVDVPVLLDTSHIIFSQAYFALKRLNRTDLHEELWHWILYAEHHWKTTEDLNKDLTVWIKAKGLNEGSWLTALHNKFTWSRLEWAQKTASQYKLNGTPAIGIKGKYLTFPSIAGTTDKCIDVIHTLLSIA